MKDTARKVFGVAAIVCGVLVIASAGLFGLRDDVWLGIGLASAGAAIVL